MPLDVDRLRVFRTVATLGSFTAAARSLAYTQPEADPPGSLQELAAGTWDLALASDYPILQREHDAALAWDPLFLDHMAVCLPVGHPGAAGGSLALKELQAETWVAPYDSV